MKKIYILFCLLLCQQWLSAQGDMAMNLYANTHLSQKVAPDNSLLGILDQIEKKFNVFFNFDPELISNQDLEKEVTISDDLNETLDRLLNPLGLIYQKLGGSYYVIFAGRKLEVKEKVNPVPELPKSSEGILEGRKDKKVGAIIPLIPRRSNFSQLLRYGFNINGQIIDSEGEPLIGVNIQVKGTNAGTSTDFEGRFSLEDIDENAVLVVSYIGYVTQEVAVAGKSNISITMASDSQLLDEVVVVGFGAQKKVNLTGSVEVIKGMDLVKRPVMNTTLALQGLASGVTVTSNSGRPGKEGETIRIRGIGTLNNNNPLILVDGVESSLNSVAANDIASISVLKDAASASIYGSRAANGVILVTTKRAEGNKFSVNLSSDFGLQQYVDIPHYLGSIDFMEMYDLALSNDTRNDKGEPGGIIYGSDFIENFKNNMDNDPYNYPNTNWASVTYKTPAFQQQHNLTFTGGTDKLKALVSINAQDQTGILPDTRLNKYRLRLNADYRLSEKFSMAVDLVGLYSKISEPHNATFAMGQIRRTPPMNSYRTPEGRPATLVIGSENPWVISQKKYVGYNNDWHQMGLINLKATYSPISNLQFDLSYAPKINFNTNKDFQDIVEYYDLNETHTKTSPQLRTIDLSKNQTLNSDIKILANYLKDFNSHHFQILGGFQQITNYYEYLSAYREQGQFRFDQINSFPINNQSTGGSANEWALQSYFGRINYDYLGKYLIEANLRYDGSSRFAEGYKWGLFPSFSLGWRLSQESIMENLDWISNAKIRASWGQLGNQIGVGNYDFAQNVNLNQQIIFNENVLNGYAITNFSTRNLSWETTTMVDIGMDIGIFNNTFEIVFDYYVKNTEGILMAIDIPAVMGYSNSPKQNAGVVENKGWDFNIIYNGYSGDLTWRVSAMLSDVHNKIIDMKGIVNNFNINTNREGYPINSLWGLQNNGLFPSWQSAQEYPITQFGKLQGGDIKYVDQPSVDNTGDGIINGDDYIVMGNTIPRYTYSFDLSTSYKNFDLGLFFQGVGKRDGYLRYDLAWAFNNNGNVQQWQRDGMWQEGETSADYPRMFIISQNNIQPSTFWMQNASYLRLKNLQFGYTLPNSVIETTFVESARLYISGQNLFTLKHMTEGNDPEQDDWSGQNNLPLLKIYSFGFNIIF